MIERSNAFTLFENFISVIDKDLLNHKLLQ